eukprot:67539-Prorocentrum_minimum.AAC.1
MAAVREKCRRLCVRWRRIARTRSTAGTGSLCRSGPAGKTAAEVKCPPRPSPHPSPPAPPP